MGNRLQAVLHGLVNNELEKKLNSFEFETRLNRTIEDVISSDRFVTKMTETVLNSQYFIAPVEKLSRKKPRKPLMRNQREKNGAVIFSRLSTVHAYRPRRQATDPQQTSSMKGKREVVLGEVKRTVIRTTCI